MVGGLEAEHRVDLPLDRVENPHALDPCLPQIGVRLAEAPSYGLPIGLYAARSRGAQAYSDLAQELLARDGKRTTAAAGTNAPAWVTR